MYKRTETEAPEVFVYFRCKREAEVVDKMLEVVTAACIESGEKTEAPDVSRDTIIFRCRRMAEQVQARAVVRMLGGAAR
jgi:hypothetical protein